MKQIRKVKSVTPVCASVIDNLVSSSTTDALSANMGRELNDKIDNLELTGGSGTGGEVLPIGTMIPFGSATDIPANWRICDGSEISRTAYSKLFKVIGTAYGEGDGETTFNLPDKRGKVSVGLDELQDEFNTIGKKGGKKEVALTVDEMPTHSHSFVRSRLFFAEEAQNNALGATSNASNCVTSTTASTGGNQAHENLQPYEVDVWIIKVDNLVSNLETTEGTIIDNLTSTSSTDALSANMGRELNNRIMSIEENGIGGDSMVTYSAEEQQIGTWIDGKPIYRITLSMGSLSGSKMYSHGIANLHRVIHAFGTFIQSSGHMEPLPKVVVNNAAWSADFADFTSTSFTLNFGSNIGTATEVTLTVEYTKTTD